MAPTKDNQKKITDTFQPAQRFSTRLSHSNQSVPQAKPCPKKYKPNIIPRILLKKIDLQANKELFKVDQIIYELFRDHSNIQELVIYQKAQIRAAEKKTDPQTLENEYRADPMKHVLPFIRDAILKTNFKVLHPFNELNYESQNIELKIKLVASYPKIYSAARYTEYAKFLRTNKLHEVHVDMTKNNPVNDVVRKVLKTIIRQNPFPKQISRRSAVATINSKIMEEYWKPFAKKMIMKDLNLEQFCEISNFEEVAQSFMMEHDLQGTLEKFMESAFILYQMFPEKREKLPVFYDLEISKKVQLLVNLISPEQEEKIVKSFATFINNTNIRELCNEFDLSQREMYHSYKKNVNQRNEGVFDRLIYLTQNTLTDMEEERLEGSLVTFLRTTNIRELQSFYTPTIPCQTLFKIYKHNNEFRKLGIFKYLTVRSDSLRSIHQAPSTSAQVELKSTAKASCSKTISSPSKKKLKRRLYTSQLDDDGEDLCEGAPKPVYVKTKQHSQSMPLAGITEDIFDEFNLTEDEETTERSQQQTSATEDQENRSLNSSSTAFFEKVQTPVMTNKKIIIISNLKLTPEIPNEGKQVAEAVTPSMPPNTQTETETALDMITRCQAEQNKSGTNPPVEDEEPKTNSPVENNEPKTSPPVGNTEPKTNPPIINEEPISNNAVLVGDNFLNIDTLSEQQFFLESTSDPLLSSQQHQLPQNLEQNGPILHKSSSDPFMSSAISSSPLAKLNGSYSRTMQIFPVSIKIEQEPFLDYTDVEILDMSEEYPIELSSDDEEGRLRKELEEGDAVTYIPTADSFLKSSDEPVLSTQNSDEPVVSIQNSHEPIVSIQVADEPVVVSPTTTRKSLRIRSNLHIDNTNGF